MRVRYARQGNDSVLQDTDNLINTKTNKHMERLMEVLSIQTTSYNQWRMFAYIIRRLKGIDNVSLYTHNGNIYATKGVSDTYPCMVSHMDTVHDIAEDLHPIECWGAITGLNRVTMEQSGIGGDDKVGVYITLEMMERFDVMKVAFFRDEEVGCAGSYEADLSFFDDCRFVLQCDRKGNDDFVTVASGVDLSSCDFQEAVAPIINSYCYKFAHGMMTDVMALKQMGVQCSVANMSCGYYRPHSHDEYVEVADVDNCMDMCISIIENCTDVYTHKHVKPKAKKGKGLWGGYEDFDYDYKYSRMWSGVSLQESPASIEVDDKQLCQDCYSEQAVEYGMCKTCMSWYTREYGI
jgi:hypothetical protein